MVRAMLVATLLTIGISPALGDTTENLTFTECPKIAASDLSSTALVVNLMDIDSGKASAHFLSTADVNELLNLLQSCPDVKFPAAAAFLKAIDARSSQLRDLNGSLTVEVFVFHQGPLATLRLKEVSRHTLIHDDFLNLLQILQKLRATGKAGNKVDIAYGRFTTPKERARLTLEVVPTKEAAKKDALSLATITTGSEEHFRLSANLPINSTHLLTYDLDKNQPTVRETPKEFLIGGDYYLGDVIADWRGRDLWKRIGARALVRPSLTAPLDTIGIVGAFRFNNFSVFAGPIWNKVPEKPRTTSGAVVEKKTYKSSIRVGLGFNLDTALGWLSKKADTAAK